MLTPRHITILKESVTRRCDHYIAFVSTISGIGRMPLCSLLEVANFQLHCLLFGQDLEFSGDH